MRTAVVSQHRGRACGPTRRRRRPRSSPSAIDARIWKHEASWAASAWARAASALPLQRLSGGQKARVSLADLTWDAPHVLLLDEQSTNHLDMQARRPGRGSARF